MEKSYSDFDKWLSDLFKGGKHTVKAISYPIVIILIFLGSVYWINNSSSDNKAPTGKNEYQYYGDQNASGSHIVQVQGNGNTVKNYPDPELSAEIFKPSQKIADRLFETVFLVGVYYVQGTEIPKHITFSKDLNCPAIDDTNTVDSYAPYGKKIFLKCTSLKPVVTTEGLFSL